ncbi:hypothetical protein CPB86DRAFT_802797 [Serendipita vermifera]|nr:hypothetical protein CPB86DRAFT_802797 [Serendipita vermifera]
MWRIQPRLSCLRLLEGRDIDAQHQPYGSSQDRYGHRNGSISKDESDIERKSLSETTGIGCSMTYETTPNQNPATLANTAMTTPHRKLGSSLQPDSSSHIFSIKEALVPANPSMYRQQWTQLDDRATCSQSSIHKSHCTGPSVRPSPRFSSSAESDSSASLRKRSPVSPSFKVTVLVLLVGHGSDLELKPDSNPRLSSTRALAYHSGIDSSPSSSSGRGQVNPVKSASHHIWKKRLGRVTFFGNVIINV